MARCGRGSWQRREGPSRMSEEISSLQTLQTLVVPQRTLSQPPGLAARPCAFPTERVPKAGPSLLARLRALAAQDDMRALLCLRKEGKGCEPSKNAGSSLKNSVSK